ncbi:MAG: hypothetical protein LBU73_07875 [Helicobacteraceae bacterium]|jgi:hypothetical protein|nr:hypothetical protein [Helicobacteraceae bacterium]
MINYWWVTRPKRRLNAVPEILATIADTALNAEWQAQRDTHLLLENALETAGVKRKGERRDQTGGGARTYIAWLKSLGLIFEQENTKKLKLTFAGEAIMAGEPPVPILKEQILKYQFPSSFSLSRGVEVSERFKIRPFRFLLLLLLEPQIEYLTQEEIGKVVIVEAENETDRCYIQVVSRILAYRQFGDASLSENFAYKYPTSKGVNTDNKYGNLLDIANTIQNWLEYTQLAKRSEDDRAIRILPDKIDEVKAILAETPKFIDRPNEHEYFQRKYGLDPKHKKDTRNLLETETITTKMLVEIKIKQAFIAESLKKPISKITADLVDKIAEKVGEEVKVVEETLLKLYPRGAIGSFMTEYFEMAFRGRDNATEFEKATAELFKTVFGFETRHIGTIDLAPDVLVLSDGEGYCGIIDNKAYSKYTISNDHHNRMVHNYTGGLKNYYDGKLPLAFFSYIAGGFGKNIDSQIKNIVAETGVHGSAVTVSAIISMVEQHNVTKYSHKKIQELFSMDKQILLQDLMC